MDYNQTHCVDTCIHFGYVGGELHIDYEVCAFQSFCDCTCPEFIPEVCAHQCEKEDKVRINGYINNLECEDCKCGCKEPNCQLKCFPYQHDLIKNTYGCLKCRCDCPDVDCDAQCGGEGLGINKTIDRTGCLVCDCRNSAKKGKKINNLEVVTGETKIVLK